MQVENSFAVSAPPDRVFAFLLDVNRVVSCVPGAQLSEVVDPDTFHGRVRIKVGPVTVAYNGTAHITGRDPERRVATLEAEGRETTGPGSARATATMSVDEAGAGSVVRLSTDFTVVGRVAQFGRGIMEDVSKRLVGQMAECIRTKLEAPEAAEPSAAPDSSAASSPAGEGAAPGDGATTDGAEPAASAAAATAVAEPVRASPSAGGAPESATSAAAPVAASAPVPAGAPTAHAPAEHHDHAALPVNALSLVGVVVRGRVRALLRALARLLGGGLMGLGQLLRRWSERD